MYFKVLVFDLNIINVEIVGVCVSKDVNCFVVIDIDIIWFCKVIIFNGYWVIVVEIVKGFI